MKSRKGFTLVELLTGIAILGIIAAMVAFEFSSQLAKGRDARRKGDLRTVQNALEAYFQEEKKYPEPDPAGVLTCYPPSQPVHCNLLESKLAPYIKKLPKDPINEDPYLYKFLMSNNPPKYWLYATLENKKDKECTPTPCAETDNYILRQPVGAL